MAESLLVLVPHMKLQGAVNILVIGLRLAENLGRIGAIKHKMSFIP